MPVVAEFKDDTSGFSKLGKDIYRWLVEDKSSVVFLGESPNRTLPLALACMRGSLDNLWVTAFDRAALKGREEKIAGN